MATTAQFTAIRVVCNNTLAVALDDNKGAVKVPHSTAFDSKAGKQQLGISVSSWNNFMCRMKLLSEHKAKHSEAEQFFKQLHSDRKQVATRAPNEHAMRKTLSIYNGQGRGAELGSAKDTALGLLNSITEFVDHERRSRNSDYRLGSAWFGQGATLKQSALEQTFLILA